MPMPERTGKFAPSIIWLAAAAVILVGAVRYFGQPSFWLDEAFIALSLRSPAIQTIFGPLEAGQLFPRVYLAIIAVLREALGYRIWVLRLLPSLSFAIATLLWARLLAKRSGRSLPAALIAGALLLGSKQASMAARADRVAVSDFLHISAGAGCSRAGLVRERAANQKLGGVDADCFSRCCVAGCVVHGLPIQFADP